jgi:hypothetical protein
MTLEQSLIQRLANAIRLEGNCPSLPLFYSESHKKVAQATCANIAFEVEQFIKDFASEDLAKGFVSECVRDS